MSLEIAPRYLKLGSIKLGLSYDSPSFRNARKIMTVSKLYRKIIVGGKGTILVGSTHKIHELFREEIKIIAEKREAEQFAADEESRDPMEIPSMVKLEEEACFKRKEIQGFDKENEIVSLELSFDENFVLVANKKFVAVVSLFDLCSQEDSVKPLLLSSMGASVPSFHKSELVIGYVIKNKLMIVKMNVSDFKASFRMVNSEDECTTFCFVNDYVAIGNNCGDVRVYDWRNDKIVCHVPSISSKSPVTFLSYISFSILIGTGSENDEPQLSFVNFKNQSEQMVRNVIDCPFFGSTPENFQYCIEFVDKWKVAFVTMSASNEVIVIKKFDESWNVLSSDDACVFMNLDTYDAKLATGVCLESSSFGLGSSDCSCILMYFLDHEGEINILVWLNDAIPADPTLPDIPLQKCSGSTKSFELVSLDEQKNSSVEPVSNLIILNKSSALPASSLFNISSSTSSSMSSAVNFGSGIFSGSTNANSSKVDNIPNIQQIGDHKLIGSSKASVIPSIPFSTVGLNLKDKFSTPVFQNPVDLNLPVLSRSNIQVLKNTEVVVLPPVKSEMKQTSSLDELFKDFEIEMNERCELISKSSNSATTLLENRKRISFENIVSKIDSLTLSCPNLAPNFEAKFMSLENQSRELLSVVIDKKDQIEGKKPFSESSTDPAVKVIRDKNENQFNQLLKSIGDIESRLSDENDCKYRKPTVISLVKIAQNHQISSRNLLGRSLQLEKQFVKASESGLLAVRSIDVPSSMTNYTPVSQKCVDSVARHSTASDDVSSVLSRKLFTNARKNSALEVKRSSISREPDSTPLNALQFRLLEIAKKSPGIAASGKTSSIQPAATGVGKSASLLESPTVVSTAVMSSDSVVKVSKTLFPSNLNSSPVTNDDIKRTSVSIVSLKPESVNNALFDTSAKLNNSSTICDTINAPTHSYVNLDNSAIGGINVAVPLSLSKSSPQNKSLFEAKVLNPTSAPKSVINTAFDLKSQSLVSLDGSADKLKTGTLVPLESKIADKTIANSDYSNKAGNQASISEIKLENPVTEVLKSESLVNAGSMPLFSRKITTAPASISNTDDAANFFNSTPSLSRKVTTLPTDASRSCESSDGSVDFKTTPKVNLNSTLSDPSIFPKESLALESKLVAPEPSESKLVAHEPKVTVTEPKVVAPEPKVIATEPNLIATEPKVVASEPAAPNSLFSRKATILPTSETILKENASMFSQKQPSQAPLTILQPAQKANQAPLTILQPAQKSNQAPLSILPSLSKPLFGAPVDSSVSKPVFGESKPVFGTVSNFSTGQNSSSIFSNSSSNSSSSSVNIFAAASKELQNVTTNQNAPLTIVNSKSEVSSFGGLNFGTGAPSTPQKNPFGGSFAPLSSSSSQIGSTSTNPFGSPPNPSTSNPFLVAASQSSSNNTQNSFAVNKPFGQNSNGFNNSTNPFSSNSTNSFGNSSTNPFGASPASANPFNAPVFGQSSSLGQPIFGQQSSLGGSQPVFGQSSALGVSSNPFGQSSTFGKPSGIGNGAPVFGQSSALGAPSAVGIFAQKPGSIFGQNTNIGQGGSASFTNSLQSMQK